MKLNLNSIFRNYYLELYKISCNDKNYHKKVSVKYAPTFEAH